MRAMLIPSALVAAFAMPAAAIAAPASLLPTTPEVAAQPSRLAPLAADSEWTPRFEAAANELAAALQSRDEARWAPMLGGRWLAATDRERIRNLLNDPDSPLSQALLAKGEARRAIFGWQAPSSLSAGERMAIETGQEAEALICWSAGVKDEGAWPATASEADNRPGRAYACARVAYSVRGNTPTWRAFIERGESGASIAADTRTPA